MTIKNENNFMLEYHHIIFPYMYKKTKSTFCQERDKSTKEIVQFYTSMFSHLSGTKDDEAIKFINLLQNRLKQELEKIISTKGIFYWFHLYRRILPVANFGGESRQTVDLYRHILESAFLKYGKDTCGNEIIYSNKDNLLEAKDIASGIYVDAFKFFGAEISPTQKHEGIYIGNFTYRNFIEIYELERLAYEFWHTTVCARRIYKNGVLFIEGKNYYVKNDSATERLMKSIDHRASDYNDFSGSDAIMLIPSDFSKGTSFIAKYNTGNASLEDYPQEKIFLPAELTIDKEIIFNFLWLPFDFDYYYNTHKFYKELFKKKFGYTMECFTYVLYLICQNEVFSCMHSSGKAGIELLERSYRYFSSIDQIVDAIMYMSSLYKLPSLENYTLDSNEVVKVLQDLQVNKEEISLVTLGPRPLLIPSINNGFNIDYASIFFILRTKTHSLKLKKDYRGYLFEDSLIERLIKSNLNLWVCKKKLKHLDGSSKQIDISFIYKNILFIAELKANNMAINYIEGNKKTLNYRKTKIIDAIIQINDNADWLLSHKEGTNYSIPPNIELIVPFVITPFPEYIWSEDPCLWLTKEIPRICTPTECCNLCNDEVLKDILTKPYIRFIK